MTRLERTGGVWIAYVPRIPGAHAWGASISGTLHRLDHAMALLGAPRPETTHIRLPPGTRADVARAKAARDRAGQARASATATTRAAVETLGRAGFSDRDVATVLEMSHRAVQRIRERR